MDAETKFILIYGASGIGKTSLALTAPEPHLVIDIEGSRSLLPKTYTELNLKKPQKAGNQYVTPAANDLVSIVRLLTKTSHHYRTVILDSVTKWQREKVATCDEGNRNGCGAEVFTFWRTIYEVTGSLLGCLQAFVLHPTHPVNVVCTAQEYTEYDDNGNVDCVRPDLYGRGREAFVQAADLVAYVSLSSSQKRYMACDLSSSVIAKHRSAYIRDLKKPIEVPLGEPMLTTIINNWKE